MSAAVAHEAPLPRPCTSCYDLGITAGPSPDDIGEPCEWCPAGDRIREVRDGLRSLSGGRR